MTSDHIVKSFDEDLNTLENLLAEMGGLAEVQFAGAVGALVRRDSEKATKVAAADVRLDELESQIDQAAVTLLARRQPMGKDLREVIATLKSAAVLERIGDYAKNLAKRTSALAELPPVPPATTIARLGGLVQEMLKDVLDAYLTRDIEKAGMVRDRDKEVDALYTSMFRELLTYMMEDPRNITACTHLLFIAKNIERVGDHATNIAENVIFMVHGHPPEGERAKEDGSSYTVVRQSEIKAR